MLRRDFMLKSLSLASALPAAAQALIRMGTEPPLVLHVLVDTRFAASQHFGDAASARGARISCYDGDLTQLWQRTLQQQWRSGRGQMAGITTARGWLCLSQLAGGYHWIARARHTEASELIAWSLTAELRA